MKCSSNGMPKNTANVFPKEYAMVLTPASQMELFAEVLSFTGINSN